MILLLADYLDRNAENNSLCIQIFEFKTRFLLKLFLIKMIERADWKIKIKNVLLCNQP